ncbi:MAG TPA: formyltransferase family protein [Gemmatimonadaceae bacterium]
MTEHADSPLSVVVLSCGSLGNDVAERLRGARGVGRITLITAPYRQKPLSLPRKLRYVHRMQGWPGLAAAVAGKLAAPIRGARDASSRNADVDGVDPAIPHLRFDDFHDPACIQALHALKPDLGVIAGTYILEESVFGVPRLGSINLHSGKVPEYRGAAPAFWELYNGETQVGITIHRVAAAVDAGGVLLQELFALDPAPAGDPLAFVERYRRDVLRPNGVRLLVEAVERIANGTAVERPQQDAVARVYRTPDYRAIRELRRRVTERRMGRTP